MNIFKVLASGRKSFQEETASAILAWFLNPTMEHGLGYSFISKFLDNLFLSIDMEDEVCYLSRKLIPRLRSEYELQLKLWSDLEYNVETAFIDIVIGIEDWMFAIENKIYTQSTTAGQLVQEYKGLRQKVPKLFKIGMIYLVPIDEKLEIIDARTDNIFNELSVKNGDFKVMVTWQKSKIDNLPSIAELIEKILEDESKGRIDPMPEYTRHTLKALKSFISNNFAGYEYDRKNMSSDLNPLTEERLSIEKLKIKNKGYVGVKSGIKGLLRMDKDKIKSYKFQYTSQDMSIKSDWIELNTFQNIIEWILNQKIREIDWEGRFPSELLFKIDNDYKERVFIGIKGGKEALRNMGNEVIKSKEWGISIDQSNDQWIDGTSFCNILEEKGIYTMK